MLSEKVLLALNDLDDSDIETVGQLLGYGRRKSNTHRRKTARRVMLLAAVVAAFLAFCAVAYAANIWGIREMLRTPHRELPEAAAEILQEQTETGENEGLRCRVTESVCDASSAMVTVAVTVSDRYIAVPTDAMPDFPAAYYGFDGEGTLVDYAESKGKTLLMVGASLAIEDVSLSQSLTIKNISDSELAILIETGKDVSAPALNAVCTVTALVYESQEVQRVEIPFTLTEGVTKELGCFVPLDPDAVPGLHLTEAVVTESALGANIQIRGTETEKGAYYNIMKIDFDEVEIVGPGSHGADENGIWIADFSLGKGSLDDTLTVHFYDCDKNPVADVVFRKK